MACKYGVAYWMIAISETRTFASVHHLESRICHPRNITFCNVKMSMKLKQLFTIILLTLIVLNLNFMPTALAADTENGTKIFSVQCAGCHINGSNIIRRGKNLKIKALKKYNMDSLEAISSIVTNGKNNMSAYKDRLSTQEIQDVAAYVLEQAEKGWR